MRAVRAVHRRAERLAEAAPRRGPAASFIVTDVAGGRDAEAAIAAARGFQAALLIRDYDAPDRAALASRLARLARRAGLLAFVGRDIDLAIEARADGVHLPEALLATVGDARRAGLAVTVAAHSAGALRKAEAAGADAALFSPVFATASHPGARAAGGLRAALAAAQVRMPVLALGGVDETTARLIPTGRVAGVAAIRGLHPG